MARFLATLAILFLIFYGFRFLRLYVFPKLIQRWLRNFAGEQFQFNQQEPNKKEGEVTITKSVKKNSSDRTLNDGEYVDFEEIKDK